MFSVVFQGPAFSFEGLGLLLFGFRSRFTPFRASAWVRGFRPSFKPNDLFLLSGFRGSFTPFFALGLLSLGFRLLLFGLRPGFTPWFGPSCISVSVWAYPFQGFGLGFRVAAFFQAHLFFFWGSGVRLLRFRLGPSFIKVSVWVYSFSGFGLGGFGFLSSLPFTSFWVSQVPSVVLLFLSSGFFLCMYSDGDRKSMGLFTCSRF